MSKALNLSKRKTALALAIALCCAWQSPVFAHGSEAHMVPMDKTLQTFGADVQWDDYAQMFTITKDGAFVKVKPGAKTAIVNGKTLKLQVPVVMKNKAGAKTSGRVCVYRLDAQSANAALRKARHESSRKQHVIRPATIESCKYVVLFTTVAQEELPLGDVFSMYRLRWQIELAFKRLKSLTGFGHLPKHDPVSCRAWLYGKLLVGLLVESMIRIPFPP